MSSAIDGLKPVLLWSYFQHICNIPHCSKREDALRDFIIEEGKKFGANVRLDDTGNVCLAVNASKGYEASPTVILQGHMDMVCEKNSDTSFNFMNDPIQMQRKEEWITATDTTLGADNGIGVAAALAAMADSSLEHGPLELLFTVDEETGLTGAMGLDPSLLTGRVLINMDSEEDGMLYVGCAGGAHLYSHLPIQWEEVPAGWVGLKVMVAGLMGGHSGCDIHENRGNAIKLLGRILQRLIAIGEQRNMDDWLRLADFDAGTAHNAIPREGWMQLCVPAEQENLVHDTVQAMLAEFASEFSNEKNLKIGVSFNDAVKRVFSAQLTATAKSLLVGVHNGVFAMSQDIKGLVETSNSLAVAKIEDDRFFVLNSTRSSQSHALNALLDQNEAVAKLAGAETRRGDGYPGWQPNMESPVLALMTRLFEQRYEKKPIITAIHAGLECGLIGERFEGMDMVSFGPEINNPHSPDECVWIPSVERFWELLADTLSAIAKGELTKG